MRRRERKKKKEYLLSRVFTLREQLGRAVLLKLRETHVTLLTVLRFGQRNKKKKDKRHFSDRRSTEKQALIIGTRAGISRVETRERSYFEQLFTALVTMLVLSHHPPYVHVHFVIDLGGEIAIVHRVSAVA